jgi:hypothetical protein
MMNITPRRRAGCGCGHGRLCGFLLVILGIIPSVFGADLSAWLQVQNLTLQQTGLVKIALPSALLANARPGLEDLRIVDPMGNEVPYVLDRPRPMPRESRRVKSFAVQLKDQTTVITVETGLDLPLDAISLESPAADFLKAVRVEGSSTGQSWQALASGQPWFRRGAASQSLLKFPTQDWKFLRLTIDDRRSEPVPVTGALVHAAASEPTPFEAIAVEIAEQIENPGQTRMTLRFETANLTLAWLELDCADPLFTRRMTAALQEVTESEIREQPIAETVVYRLAVENQTASSNLILSLERHIPSRDLIVLVQNDDSPPLRIRSIKAMSRPVYAVFSVSAAGIYQFYCGHATVAAPRYDVARVANQLRRAPVAAAQLGALEANPRYRAPETLPQVGDLGAELDITSWEYRKSVSLSQAGIQQLELDLDILAHAQADFRDLRLMRSGRQVPYLIERPSITRRLALEATLDPDADKPAVTRWKIKLPRSRLPLAQLRCSSPTPLFKRTLELYELNPDDRGELHHRSLGYADWTRIPERNQGPLVVSLGSHPVSDTLYLVTDNGDNPPIELNAFEAYYPATRLVFKSSILDGLELYYGSPSANRPTYDLSLVATQLLRADKRSSQLRAEEQLGAESWARRGITQHAGVLFWGALFLVVIGLLVIVARLLPRQGPAPP